MGKGTQFCRDSCNPNRQELYKRWQENVKPTDYEDLCPFIERHKNGEENLLFPGKPMMYATTSGTAKEPKWIPITNEYYDNAYSKMTKLWLHSFQMHRPKVFENVCTSIVGKAIEGAAPDGTVYGSVSGVTRRDCPEFIKGLYAENNEVYAISDYKARYYTIMRTGIEQDVHLLVTANPSTIVEMQNNVNEFFDEYVKDIENGTLNEDLKIEPEIRAVIAAGFKPNPQRAAELRALKEKYEVILPKHYWPNIQVLPTWKCGNTKVYKVNGIISLTGEKLHERQFIEAVHQAEKETGMTTRFFVGFADLENSNYRWYYEFADQSIGQAKAEEFSQVVDQKLKALNCEYEAKRDSFRVKDPATFLLQPESFETFKARSIERGARDGQFKMNLLMQDEKRHAMFKELIKK